MIAGERGSRATTAAIDLTRFRASIIPPTTTVTRAGGGHLFARAMLPLAPVQFPHTIPNVVPRGTYVFPVVDASADLARDERALETRVRE